MVVEEVTIGQLSLVLSSLPTEATQHASGPEGALLGLEREEQLSSFWQQARPPLGLGFIADIEDSKKGGGGVCVCVCAFYDACHSHHNSMEEPSLSPFHT